MALDKLTIPRTHTSKDDVALLIDNDILNTILSPFSQQDDNLLSSPATRDGHAKMRSRRLDAEKTGKPILLDFNVACSSGSRLAPFAQLMRPATANGFADSLRVWRRRVLIFRSPYILLAFLGPNHFVLISTYGKWTFLSPLACETSKMGN